jgi:hypothetical protein
MSQSEFPQGWDEQRVRAVIEHYERQTEDEAVAEYRTAVARRGADDAMRRRSKSKGRAEYGPHEHFVSEVAEKTERYDKDGE